MAARTNRRPSNGNRTRSSARRTAGSTTRKSVAQSFALPPHVARSLIGLLFLVVGAVTVIALLFPQA
ncbi:MAG TPA: hypothetical protein VIK00_00780, partial [Candidatus Limnocylindrales bacterium]